MNAKQRELVVILALRCYLDTMRLKAKEYRYGEDTVANNDVLVDLIHKEIANIEWLIWDMGYDLYEGLKSEPIKI